MFVCEEAKSVKIIQQCCCHTQVMKRLWSTLACLGVTRVYITGAEKVEKVYFASHALKSEKFYPELIHGRHLPCRYVPLNPTWAVTK